MKLASPPILFVHLLSEKDGIYSFLSSPTPVNRVSNRNLHRFGSGSGSGSLIMVHLRFSSAEKKEQFEPGSNHSKCCEPVQNAVQKITVNGVELTGTALANAFNNFFPRYCAPA